MTANGQASLSRDADRRLHQAEREEQDAARERRFQAARDAVRSFAGEHVDVAAMSLILLEIAHPGRGFSPGEIMARAEAGYGPWEAPGPQTGGSGHD